MTGASSGIGRGVAIECAARGANLILVGRNLGELSRTAESFPSVTKHVICRIDLLDTALIAGELQQALDQLGPVHGFAHCAGTASSIPLRMFNHEDCVKDYVLNTVSAFEIAKLLSMKKNFSPDGASFVFVASASAHRGVPGKSVYASTKGALLAAAKSLAAELAPKRIRVNTVSPGYVAGTGITGQDFDNLPESAQEKIKMEHPFGLGTVSDVALPVVFLLSDAARWITGTDLLVDGGYCL